MFWQPALPPIRLVEPAAAEQSLIGARPAMITPPHRPWVVSETAPVVFSRAVKMIAGRRAFRIDPRAAVDDQQIVGLVAAIGDHDHAGSIVRMPERPVELGVLLPPRSMPTSTRPSIR
jgi:hypothetical protein